jgi:hypothetical protein
MGSSLNSEGGYLLLIFPRLPRGTLPHTNAASHGAGQRDSTSEGGLTDD